MVFARFSLLDRQTRAQTASLHLGNHAAYSVFRHRFLFTWTYSFGAWDSSHVKTIVERCPCSSLDRQTRILILAIMHSIENSTSN